MTTAPTDQSVCNCQNCGPNCTCENCTCENCTCSKCNHAA